MGSAELSEIEIVQNTALTTTMIWQCGIGYQKESESRPMNIPLAFLVLPICLHRTTLDLLLSTQRRSGLSLFAAKLAENREDLLSVHTRALSYRTLTLDSIGLGIASQLFTIDYDTAQVRSNTFRIPKQLPDRIRPLTQGAERLGVWFGRLELAQIAATLRVNF